MSNRTAIGTKQVIATAGLNLRSGPTTTDSIIIPMVHGTVVEVIKEGEWDFIRVGGQEGYASSKWLSPLKPVGVGRHGKPAPAAVQPAKLGTTIDLLPYIKGDGRQYEVKNASGGQERFQTQEDDSIFYQVKNAQWEQFFSDNDFIYRDVDTSPGGGRYYRLKDPDRQSGSRWLRRRMAVGDSYTQRRRVQFYNKGDGSQSNDNSGDVTDTMTLVAHHKKHTFQTGVDLEDVIELRWNQGERYFYARGYGLVGWAREHQDPNSPSWSAISEKHQPGARDPFVREQVRIG